MAVKLVLLKSGENIISDTKEGFLDEKLVCYILEKPCNVNINGSYKILDDEDGGKDKLSISLHPWPALSKQEVIELIPDWIITIVDPTDELKGMYETQVLGVKKDEIDQSVTVNEQSDSDQSD